LIPFLQQEATFSRLHRFPLPLQPAELGGYRRARMPQERSRQSKMHTTRATLSRSLHKRSGNRSGCPLPRNDELWPHTFGNPVASEERTRGHGCVGRFFFFSLSDCFKDEREIEKDLKGSLAAIEAHQDWSHALAQDIRSQWPPFTVRISFIERTRKGGKEQLASYS
jgi:hypothetical protein